MTLNTWLNPDDDNSRTEASGRVTALADQADTNDMAETGSSGPPTGAVINARTVLDFSDRLDYLQKGSTWTWTGPDLTVIVAYTDDGGIAGSDDESLVGASNGASLGWSLKKEFATTDLRFNVEAASGLQVPGGATVLDIDIVVARFDSVRDFAEIMKNVNGNVASTDRAVTITNSYDLEIGNDGSGVRGWGSGLVSDVIIFDGVMRYDQIARVEGYLAHKHNVAVDMLPNGHAFKAHWPDVVIDADFLANFEGADAATTYTAEAGGAATFVGQAQLDQQIAHYGTASLLLDGTGDYVTFPDAANYDFAADDFTVECWVRWSSDPGTGKEYIVSHWDANSGNFRGWAVKYDNDRMGFLHSTTGVDVIDPLANITITVGAWHHIAVCRTGNVLNMFFDGALVSSAAFTATIFSNAATLDVGSLLQAGGRVLAEDFTGNIDGIRIIKGKGIYTSAFDPPHRSFHLPTQATLICNFNGPDAGTTYTSEDASARTATFQNNAQLDTAQKKFGHASALFDGTDDWIDFPDSTDWEIGTGDFSLELWVRFNGDPGTAGRFLCGHYTVTGDQRGWLLDLDNNTLRFGWTTDGTAGTFASVSSTWNPVGSQWYHVEVERISNRLYMYIDGVCIGQHAFSATPFAAAAPFSIGGTLGGANDHNGWIDGLRFMKGEALRHTPRPVEAGSTAQGFVKTLTIDFEGVDTQTTYESEDGRTVNFGTGSSLDDAQRARGATSLVGNDDGVNVASNAGDLQIGTTDFGFECFIRSTVASTDKVFWDQRTTTTQAAPAAYVKSNNQFGYFVNGADQIAGGTFAANTWYHILIQRIEGLTSMFVDGTLIGTWVDSTNYIDSTMYIGTRFNLVTGWNGWIDHVRFDPNNALYGGDFDVPVHGAGEPTTV